MLALVLIPPFLFALTGIIDTYLVHTLGAKQKEGTLKSSIATLMIIGGLVAFLFVVGIFCVLGTKVFAIPVASIWKIIFAGVFRGLALYPYFRALQGEKIENITPAFQTISLFSYVFANLLIGERLGSLSVILMIGIIVATSLFMRNFSTKTINRKGIGRMLLSSLLYACSFVGFKFGSESIDSTRIIYFRNYVGVSIVLLSLLIHRSVRNSTLQYFQHSGIQMGSLNFCNESLSIIASSINNFVALFIGVAVVQTISNGLQPLFSFLLVFLASCCLPSIYLWKYRKKELARKIVLCIISFVLLFLFYHIS